MRKSNAEGAAAAIKSAAGDALLVYQYRAKLDSARPDGTPRPQVDLSNKIAGQDFTIVPIVRRLSTTNSLSAFKEDLPAVEGAVYLVKCTQLVFDTTGMITGTAGKIREPKGSAFLDNADAYPEAVIAFMADFYIVPVKSAGYFGTTGKFPDFYANAKNPVFSRNLAVRR